MRYICFLMFTAASLMGQRYSYQQIVQKTLMHNHNLKKTAAQLKQAQILIDKAYSFLLPTISATGIYTINKEINLPLPFKDANGNPIEMSQQRKYVYTGNITANYTLMNLRSFPLLKAAKKMKEIQATSRELVVDALKYAIGEIYINILSMETLIEVNEASQKNLNNHLKNVKRRLALRNAMELEKLQTEVEIAKIGTQIQQTKGTIKQLKATLGVFMGTDEIDFDLEPVSFRGEETSFKNAYHTARLGRKENMVNIKQIELEELMLEDIKMQWTPTLMLQGKYNYTNAGGDEMDKDSWSIGVVLSMPIFNSGIRIHEERSQRVKISGLRHQIGEVNDQIKQEIRSVLIEIENIKLTLKQIDIEQKLAAHSLSLSKEAYNLGVGKNIDILDGVYKLQLVDITRAMEQLKLNMAYFKLKKAMGKL